MMMTDSGAAPGARRYSDGEDNSESMALGIQDDSTGDCARHQHSRGGSERDRELVWKETRAVRRTKIVSFLAIIVIGVVVSVGAYYLVWFDEEADFREKFLSHAKEIAQVSETTLQRSFSIVDGLSKSITNAATMMNQTFPFVTLSNFHEVGGAAKDVSGVDVIILAPLVKTDQLPDWEEYTGQNKGWVRQGLDHRDMPRLDPGPVPTEIHPATSHDHHKVGEVHIPDYHLPVWQMAHAPVNASIVNRDLFAGNSFEHRAWDVLTTRQPILSDACDFSFLAEYDVVANPYSIYLIDPVFDQFGPGGKVVAFLIAIFPWNTYFHEIMMDDVQGIHVVVDDGCGDTLTYELQGSNSIYVGYGDLHEAHREFDHYAFRTDFAAKWEYKGEPHEPVNGTSYDERFDDTSRGHCKYTLSIYPTSALRDSQPSYAAFAAIATALIFAIILCFLALYDCMVIRRQQRLMATATRTNAIVKDLFPEEIQARLMAEQEQAEKQAKSTRNTLLNSAMDYWSMKSAGRTQKCKEETPIADLFPATTIFFADIVGFTAWSSSREPTQVFALLERLYSEFDQVAEARRVFKVETVGDCYVAVAGLPNRRKDHAVAMARFANECLSKFGNAVKQLEASLGPDTADLGLRVGMHSGAVTAGVLRGDRARFQLFGDTMNTASRMESTSRKNRIQLSEDTANHLLDAGKGHWIMPREDKVVAKGKGEMSTYWLCLKSRSHEESTTSSEGGGIEPDDLVAEFYANDRSDGSLVTKVIDERRQRLVKWNTGSLLRLLNRIQASRSMRSQAQRDAIPLDARSLRELEQRSLDQGGIPLHYVVDVLVLVRNDSSTLPKSAQSRLDRTTTSEASKAADAGVSEAAAHQLSHFVETISLLHRSRNAFSNFDHGSHVTMVATNMLHRVETSHEERVGACAEKPEADELADALSADPLTRFACTFAALVHHVDHPGVVSQFVTGKTSLAASYEDTSVLEQNAFDVAWNLFMGDFYVDLRDAIYQTEDEFKRFRQLVLNLVLATDIEDVHLNQQRQERWDNAFQSALVLQDAASHVTPDDLTPSRIEIVNRRSTVVLEYCIQAAVVAHAMQHWPVYLKWNQACFRERRNAYLQGRAGEKDPADLWFANEARFFDNKVIPLARKLVDCGIFGSLGKEFLAHAERNRDEWNRKGNELVARMTELEPNVSDQQLL